MWQCYLCAAAAMGAVYSGNLVAGAPCTIVYAYSHPTPYAPLPAPWPTAAERDSALDADGAELASPSQRHGGTQAWPMSDAPRLWAAAAATADRVTAVFGVARAEPWRLRGITHAAVLDLSQQQIVPGVAEPGRPAKTGDGPEPGVTRGKGRALIMKWRKRA